MVRNLYIHNAYFKAILVAVLFFSIPASAQKKATTDTFKLVNNLIAKKKFGKANRILGKYAASHPNDMNAHWLRARANLFMNNNKRADKHYQAAMQSAPKNDYLKLDYIHSLADMGKTEQAEMMLSKMEDAGSEYSDINVMRARLYYYKGDYQKAEKYIKKALQSGSASADAAELNDLIELARALKLSLNAGYLSDNQPLKVLSGTVKAEKTFSKYASLSVTGMNYHFMQQTTSDAPWIKVNNKMFFAAAGMHLSYGAGVLRFPTGSKTTWTGEFNLNQRISSAFDLDLGVDRGAYFGTKASVDTAITATRLSANLNFHKNNWLAQVAYLNSLFPDNNSVYSVYGWFLAPVAVFSTGSLQLGLSGSYNNSGTNKYVPVKSFNEILQSGAPVDGVYSPYFTPVDQYIGAALLSFHVDASKHVSFYINCDLGYGSIYNPYLFLDKDASGTTFINKGYTTEHFTPYSASFALSYRIARTWLLNAKYTYRSTYFFNSNYLTVGLEKSFLHANKASKAKDKKSAFAKSIQYIEDMLASIYRRKNSKDIKQDVLNIKKEITTLRDALQKKLNTSEITPGSDKAIALKDKISSLDDMLNDIDSVDLDDMDKAANKREWLTSKQYELANIHYNGTLDDE